MAVQAVGITSIGNGVSLAAGATGSSQYPNVVVKSLVAGPGIQLDVGHATVTLSTIGLPPALAASVTANVYWSDDSNPANHPIFTAVYPMVVTAILGRVEQPTTGQSATLTLVKMAHDVAIADGTPLTSNAFDAKGTAAAVQVLTLVDDVTVLTLDVHDSIGVQTTGTWTQAFGGITVHMAPAPNQ